jgi:hypothetical protein
VRCTKSVDGHGEKTAVFDGGKGESNSMVPRSSFIVPIKSLSTAIHFLL